MAARSLVSFALLAAASAAVVTFAACGSDDSDVTPPDASSPAEDGGDEAATDADGPADAGLDAPVVVPDAGWVGPDGGISGAMNFFVTSKGKGNGGDFRADPSDADGLAGADAFCKSLAEAVSPVLGAKTWRAYLSTSTVTARSRIGPGPWVNAKGVVIANDTAHLHDEGAPNLLSLDTNLDENGEPVPISGPNEHDILTGATASGGSAADTCANWTSSATDVKGQVGHSNRNGGGSAPTSWNASHASFGCAEAGENSVRRGGGRGSIYCFAN
ncbi:MAG: hypothetical protein KIS78_14905 [Labilithrix sp.]|nr:hypothetical protein [Labilithrix sp.]MCW5833690.1 hypothetical protein [Labilithrix sp.]